MTTNSYQRASVPPPPTLEASHGVDERNRIWFGLRYFQFDEDDTGVIGKLSPAFVFLLGREWQGKITLNPTLYLHELGFGGGNVQLQLPL